MSNILEPRAVHELLDQHFYIPYYQRGYRWTEQQVNQLLDDVWEYARLNDKADAKDRSFYCLQPVVAKPKKWKTVEGETINGYEIIDGQQRITTLYILIQYLMINLLREESLMKDYNKELFTIEYETRPGSRKFLSNIVEDNSNVDYYYMHQARTTIDQWFTDESKQLIKPDKDLFLKALLGRKEDMSSLQVIWYGVARESEAEQDINESKVLFNRLNIGKINLTNAELIKALFLASDKFREDGVTAANRKKTIIAQLWGQMEKDLNNPSFWSFITNNNIEDYPTKIELLFDYIANKNSAKKDYYYTFLHFLELANNADSLWESWQRIELYYNMLKEWYSNRNKYHKIGFLIATGERVDNLLEEGIKNTKTDFEQHLNSRIKAKINFSLVELDYTSGKDKKNILNLLTLFNVETTRQLENDPTFYPFLLHKSQHWSIEHIQAQNSENFNPNKKEPWLEWIKIHLSLLEKMNEVERKEPLDKTMAKLKKVDEDKISWEDFQKLFTEVVDHFESPHDKKADKLHTLSNLALLTDASNAALNNAVFLAKRNHVIQLDKKGYYIPICTKRLFLSYYSDHNQLNDIQFWTGADRKNYFINILSMLKGYLSEENLILLDKESKLP